MFLFKFMFDNTALYIKNINKIIKIIEQKKT